MKKSIIAILATLMVSFIFLPTYSQAATSFKDVKKSHWAYSNILQATEKGYFSGYPDGTFKPSTNVTRAEALSTLVRVLGLEKDESAYPFTYDKRSPWAHGYVGAAAKAGIIDVNDYGMWFNPTNPVPRAELAKWISNALVYEDKAYEKALKSTNGTLLPLPKTERDSIAKNKEIPYVAVMMGTGIMVGDTKGYFRPNGKTTRAEIATVLLRVEKAKEKSPNDFFHLQELMEVGETGTNLETVTIYRVLEGNEFTKIRNKPISLAKGGGKVYLNRLILLDDASSKDNFKSIYANMFNGPDTKVNASGNHLVFIEKRLEPSVKVDNKYYDNYYANGATQALVMGWGWTHGDEAKYGLEFSHSNFPALINKVDGSYYWERTSIKTSPSGIGINSITTNDGSRFFFRK